MYYNNLIFKIILVINLYSMDSIISNGFSMGIIANNLSVYGDKSGEIPLEKIVYKNSHFYSLPENSEYKIKLGNNNFMRVDAHVWIDGIKIGVWRINPESSIIIDKTTKGNKKFILMKEGTQDAIVAGIRSGAFDNGLITVKFIPEKLQPAYEIKPNYSYHDDPTEYPYLCDKYTDTVTPSTSSNRFCAMNTLGYLKHTDNSLSHGTLFKNGDRLYKKVEPLKGIDNMLVTTVVARLVVDDDLSSYRKKFMMHNEGDVRNIPQRLDLKHPARPHTCNTDSKYTLSRKYWFDNLN